MWRVSVPPTETSKINNITTFYSFSFLPLLPFHILNIWNFCCVTIDNLSLLIPYRVRHNFSAFMPLTCGRKLCRGCPALPSSMLCRSAVFNSSYRWRIACLNLKFYEGLVRFWLPGFWWWSSGRPCCVSTPPGPQQTPPKTISTVFKTRDRILASCQILYIRYNKPGEGVRDPGSI